jgi:hypothetical protein
MTAEAALLTALPACATLALGIALARLVILFAAPYVDPAERVASWRGPRFRTWLLLTVLGAFLGGGALIYGLILVMLDKDMPGLVKLAAYFGTISVGAVAGNFLFASLEIQKRLADSYARHTSRHLSRSGLLETGLLFAFGLGVLWSAGFHLLDVGDITALAGDGLEERLRMLRCVAYWTFFAGAALLFMRTLSKVEGMGRTILVFMTFSGAVSVFDGAYKSATLNDYEIEGFIRHRDYLPNSVAEFSASVLQAEVLALSGLALILILMAAPLLDFAWHRFAPGLEARFGRLVGLTAALAASVTVFKMLGSSGDDGGVFGTFLAATAVGMLLAIAAPLWTAALKSGAHAARVMMDRWRILEWAVPISIVLAFVLGGWLLSLFSGFQFVAALLGAMVAVGAGSPVPEPETREPVLASAL